MFSRIMEISASRHAPKTSSIHPSARRAQAVAGFCLALCAAAACATSDAVPRKPPTPTKSPASSLSGYSVVYSFLFYNSPVGHGPLAGMTVGKHADDTLIGANFFGGDMQPRCGCTLGGVLYSMTPEGTVTTLHAFSGADGIGPNGSLAQGTDGLWYGLTLGGGAFGHGTAYRVARDGTRFEVLHSFGATPLEGSQPSPGPLALAADGSFYGTTTRGGSAGKGTLFRMTPDGAVTTLHDFAGSPADGWDPEDQPIVASDGNVYGATTCGGKRKSGAHCGGTVYRLSPSGSYALLHMFDVGDDGYEPLSSPVQVGQRLFGTTSAGGSGGFGAIYRLDLDGTHFDKLHDFGGGLVASPPNDDGARPVGRLAAASDGQLYGTTSNGGPNQQMYPAGDGTLFRVDRSGAYALLGTLGSAAGDAAHPVAALVEGRDGYLYGTSDNGGAFASGAVFRFRLPSAPFVAGAGAGTAANSRRHPRRARKSMAQDAADARNPRPPTRRLGREMITAAALAAAACGVHAQVPANMVEYSKAWSLIVADFDGDGQEDIFIAGHDQEDRIWYGSPTGFRPGPQPLPWADRHGCAAADVDRDGRLDFFCAIGVEKGTGKANNELWHQEADGTFTKVSNFGAEDPYGRGRKPVFLDLDGDKWPDLYVTNDGLIREDGQANVNHMYLNQRDGTFVEVTTVATGSPAKPGQPGDQCAVRGDVDGDGWDDLLVCNHDGPGHIFINNHHKDFDKLASAATASVWKDAKLVDMNADGRDDLVVVTGDNHLQIWLNTGASPYFVAPALDANLPAEAVSLTTGDFDGDSRRDVYVVLRGQCKDGNGQADAPDVLFVQPSPGQWSMQGLAQSFGGCGYAAETIGVSKVLLANGTVRAPGPNYVLTFRGKATRDRAGTSGLGRPNLDTAGP